MEKPTKVRKKSLFSEKLSECRAYFGAIKQEKEENEELFDVVRKPTRNSISQRIQQIREAFKEIKQENEEICDENSEQIEKALKNDENVIKTANSRAIRQCRLVSKAIKEDKAEKRGNDSKLIKKPRIKYSRPKKKKTKKKIEEKICKFCGKQYAINANMSCHYRIMHAQELKDKLHICDYCGKRFFLKHKLLSHMIKKHVNGKIETFECDFDGRIFKQKGNFKAHMKTHLPTIKCHLCGREFKEGWTRRHMEDVHGAPHNLKCVICHKTYATHESFRKHKKNHNKIFECEFCKKKFPTPSRLKCHKSDYHWNPKSYECKICNKAFDRKTILTKHLEIHDPNRPKRYKCSRCGFATDSRAYLKYHIAIHEKKDQKIAAMVNPVKCEKCSTLCRSREAMWHHKYVVHRMAVHQCDLCGRNLKLKRHLVRHIKLVHLKIKCQ